MTEKMTMEEIVRSQQFRRKHLAICREIGSPVEEERRLWDVLTLPDDVAYVPPPPHPDTARADAAERMLAEVIELIRGVARQECERLESELSAARAEAARLDAELAAMGGDEE